MTLLYSVRHRVHLVFCYLIDFPQFSCLKPCERTFCRYLLLCIFGCQQILFGFQRGLIVLWNIPLNDVQRAYISLQVCCWPTVLSVAPMAQCVICLSSVVCDVLYSGETAGPICMKFSGKVWSDMGRPDYILGQFG